MTRRRNKRVLAGLLLSAAVLFAAAGLGQGDQNGPGDIPWNITVPPSSGHTGRILVRPEGQLHEGPGHTGVDDAAYHWHGTDPNTGELHRPGTPLDKKGNPIKPTKAKPPAPATQPSPGGAAPATQPSKETMAAWTSPLTGPAVDAAMKQDWKALEVELLRHDEAILSPLARLLLGHAYLATNRNNESLLMFWSCMGGAERNAWARWTEDLARRRTNGAMSIYLHGDALARLSRWGPAIDEFTAALKKDPKSGVVMNAMGVCFAALGKWNETTVCLAEACQASPNLADAFASRGTSGIHRMNGPEGAMKAFNAALKLAPGCALALNGRGAVLVVLNRIEDAEKDLGGLRETSIPPIREMVLANMNATAGTRARIAEAMLASVTGTKAGTTITKESLQNLTPAQVASYKGVLEDNLRWNRNTMRAQPDQTTVTGNLGVGANASISGTGQDKAKLPTVGADLNAGIGVQGTFSEKASHLAAIQHQENSLRLLDQVYPQVQAARVNSISSMIQSAIDPKQNELSKPGGVSTAEIGAAPVEGGNWKVVSTYGLLYPIPAAPASGRGSAAPRTGAGGK